MAPEKDAEGNEIKTTRRSRPAVCEPACLHKDVSVQNIMINSPSIFKKLNPKAMAHSRKREEKVCDGKSNISHVFWVFFSTNLSTDTLLFLSSAVVFFHPSSVLTQL